MTGNVNPRDLQRRHDFVRAVAFFLFVGMHFASVGSTPADLADLVSAPPQELRARIDSASAKLGAALSPAGREVSKQSLSRFYRWVSGYCRGDEVQSDLSPDAQTCIRNQYFNYLARIPDSVYRIGQWTVFETGIYGLIWADDDLQGEDAARPFTWDLQVVWPRVDADHSPLADGFSAALAEQIRVSESSWAASGWERGIEVRLAAIGDCYISATVTGSTYGGGAHPYEDYGTFNWNRRTKRAIYFAGLLQAKSESQNGVFNLYKRRLGQSATGISDDSLRQSLQSGFLLTDNALRVIEQEGRSRMERLPQVDIPWSELSSWVLPGVPCAPASPKTSQEGK